MTVCGSQMEALEGRFAHILQPIKDLTKNWDVDIASLLEDYLEELDHITVSFDGGQTTLNFSQAAMLVQSSAGVYSRKVDYLYHLVSEVLNLLANRRKQAQKQASNEEENESQPGVHDDEDDDEFLSLDDMQESRNVYMKEDFDSREKFVFLPEIPLCLLPVEGEKGENPLLSKKGEVLASRNDFRMNTCHMHPSGAMLLDMAHLMYLEESLKQIPPASPDDLAGRLADLVDLPEITPNTSGNEHHENIGMGVDEVDGGIPMLEVSEEPDQMEVEHPVAGDGDGGSRRSGRQRREPLVELVAVPLKPPIDPLEPLDPHLETRTAKLVAPRDSIFKRCSGIEDKNKRRKCSHGKRVSVSAPLSEYISQIFKSNLQKLPMKSHRSLFISGLEARVSEELNNRQAILKEQKMQQQQQPWSDGGGDGDADTDEPALDESPQGFGDEFGAGEMEPLVDDNLLNAINEGMRCNASFAQNYKPTELLEDGIVADSYEDLVRKHVENYIASAQDYAQITELSRRVAEWEEKVIPRLEEEDRHAPYDVNTYSCDIINRLQLGNSVSFQQLVDGKPAYEICRTFLVTLMLANTGNVQIEDRMNSVDTDQKEGSIPSFNLKLLSKQSHFEKLQEYQAPSVSQTNN